MIEGAALQNIKLTPQTEQVETKNNEQESQMNSLFCSIQGSLQDYINIQPIGVGAGSLVVKVQCVKTNKDYAIKVVEKKSEYYKTASKRLSNEIEVHLQLKYKHIVRMKKSFEDSENIYMVMEYCEGGDLFHYLKHNKRLDEKEAMRISYEFAMGLKYLHDQHIIHRDLKLGNILLTRDYTVKICDFGLAARLSGDEQEKNTICGTPNYISPEILRKQPYGMKIDCWSFGCVLYALITGSPPFQGQNVAQTLKKVANQDHLTFPQNISSKLKDLLNNIIDWNQESRFTIDQILNHTFYDPIRNPQPQPDESLSFFNSVRSVKRDEQCLKKQEYKSKESLNSNHAGEIIEMKNKENNSISSNHNNHIKGSEIGAQVNKIISQCFPNNQAQSQLQQQPQQLKKIGVRQPDNLLEIADYTTNNNNKLANCNPQKSQSPQQRMGIPSNTNNQSITNYQSSQQQLQQKQTSLYPKKVSQEKLDYNKHSQLLLKHLDTRKKSPQNNSSNTSNIHIKSEQDEVRKKFLANTHEIKSQLTPMNPSYSMEKPIRNPNGNNSITINNANQQQQQSTSQIVKQISYSNNLPLHIVRNNSPHDANNSKQETLIAAHPLDSFDGSPKSTSRSSYVYLGKQMPQQQLGQQQQQQQQQQTLYCDEQNIFNTVQSSKQFSKPINPKMFSSQILQNKNSSIISHYLPNNHLPHESQVGTSLINNMTSLTHLDRFSPPHSTTTTTQAHSKHQNMNYTSVSTKADSNKSQNNIFLHQNQRSKQKQQIHSYDPSKQILKQQQQQQLDNEGQIQKQKLNDTEVCPTPSCYSSVLAETAHFLPPKKPLERKSDYILSKERISNYSNPTIFSTGTNYLDKNINSESFNANSNNISNNGILHNQINMKNSQIQKNQSTIPYSAQMQSQINERRTNQSTGILQVHNPDKLNMENKQMQQLTNQLSFRNVSKSISNLNYFQPPSSMIPSFTQSPQFADNQAPPLFFSKNSPSFYSANIQQQQQQQSLPIPLCKVSNKQDIKDNSGNDSLTPRQIESRNNTMYQESRQQAHMENEVQPRKHKSLKQNSQQIGHEVTNNLKKSDIQQQQQQQIIDKEQNKIITDASQQRSTSIGGVSQSLQIPANNMKTYGGQQNQSQQNFSSNQVMRHSGYTPNMKLSNQVRSLQTEGGGDEQILSHFLKTRTKQDQIPNNSISNNNISSNEIKNNNFLTAPSTGNRNSNSSKLSSENGNHFIIDQNRMQSTLSQENSQQAQITIKQEQEKQQQQEQQQQQQQQQLQPNEFEEYVGQVSFGSPGMRRVFVQNPSENQTSTSQENQQQQPLPQSQQISQQQQQQIKVQPMENKNDTNNALNKQITSITRAPPTTQSQIQQYLEQEQKEYSKLQKQQTQSQQLKMPIEQNSTSSSETAHHPLSSNNQTTNYINLNKQSMVGEQQKLQQNSFVWASSQDYFIPQNNYNDIGTQVMKNSFVINGTDHFTSPIQNNKSKQRIQTGLKKNEDVTSSFNTSNINIFPNQQHGNTKQSQQIRRQNESITKTNNNTIEGFDSPRLNPQDTYLSPHRTTTSQQRLQQQSYQQQQLSTNPNTATKHLSSMKSLLSATSKRNDENDAMGEEENGLKKNNLNRRPSPLVIEISNQNKMEINNGTIEITDKMEFIFVIGNAIMKISQDGMKITLSKCEDPLRRREYSLDNLPEKHWKPYQYCKSVYKAMVQTKQDNSNNNNNNFNKNSVKVKLENEEGKFLLFENRFEGYFRSGQIINYKLESQILQVKNNKYAQTLDLDLKDIKHASKELKSLIDKTFKILNILLAMNTKNK